MLHQHLSAIPGSFGVPHRITPWPAAACLAVVAVTGACGGDPVAPLGDPPVITAASVAANPHNVLSAVVTVTVEGADSVAVRHGMAGSAPATLTRAVTTAAGQATVPVLGLEASTDYTLEVVAYGGGHAVDGNPMAFTTGALPVDLPSFVTGGTDPSPGFVAFAAGNYGLVIANSGRVVWYRHFPEGIGLNFQPQSGGRYSVRPPTWQGSADAPWLELDALGNVVREMRCANGLVSRFHDFLLEPDGDYWIMCDDTRTVDLSASGGLADALVSGTAVQRVTASGALAFHWSPFEHLDLLDLPVGERAGPTVNWTHGNALDLDTDGQLLLSSRNLSEITKINVTTGEVTWRMGGSRNQFTFQGPAGTGYARQHSVRTAGPGALILLDNLGDPVASRAERYVYDAAAKTVRLDRSDGSLPPVLAGLGGTVQALPGNRMLVTFGTGRRVEEYDAAGSAVWWIESPHYVFRAHRFPSLYQPGAGAPR